MHLVNATRYNDGQRTLGNTLLERHKPPPARGWGGEKKQKKKNLACSDLGWLSKKPPRMRFVLPTDFKPHEALSWITRGYVHSVSPCVVDGDDTRSFFFFNRTQGISSPGSQDGGGPSLSQQ